MKLASFNLPVEDIFEAADVTVADSDLGERLKVFITLYQEKALDRIDVIKLFAANRLFLDLCSPNDTRRGRVLRSHSHLESSYTSHDKQQ